MELDFTPWVYLDRNRHSYVRIRSGPKYHLFLTMESGDIDVVKIPIQSEKMATLTPYNCDYNKALRTYTESTLARTPAAAKELALLLGNHGATCPSRKVVAPEFTEHNGGEYTIEQLAKEFDLTPQVARKILRKRMEKPGNRWVWPSPEEAQLARDILAQHS